MPTVLVFDVATSRFHTDKKTGEEPRVIRLAFWRSTEPTPICLVIRPVGAITIDPKTVAYHDLTVEDVTRYGIDPSEAVKRLGEAGVGVDAIVTYNADYHWRQLYRLMGVEGASPPAVAVDAMRLATPIVAIESMRPGGGLKNPSLLEACDALGVDRPHTLSGPMVLGITTVQAIYGVYTACVALTPKADE